MSFYNNVTMAFKREEWPEIRDKIIENVGLDKYMLFVKDTETYIDNDTFAIKWKDVNNFHHNPVGKLLLKASMYYDADYVICGEDGNVEILLDLEYIKFQKGYGLLPNETTPEIQDDLISELVGRCLLLGFSETELEVLGDKDVLQRYIQSAKSKFGLDDSSLDGFWLTPEGFREINFFLNEAWAKRKEILDAGIDTADDTPEISFGDVINEVPTEFGTGDMDDEYLEGFGVTDEHSTSYPICLKSGKHVIPKNPSMWINAYTDNDVELKIESLHICANAIINKSTKGKVTELMLDKSHEVIAPNIGAWVTTDDGNIFVVVSPIE